MIIVCPIGLSQCDWPVGLVKSPAASVTTPLPIASTLNCSRSSVLSVRAIGRDGCNRGSSRHITGSIACQLAKLAEDSKTPEYPFHRFLNGPEQGIKLLGLLLTGSTGQHMASRNGLA